VSVPAGNGGNFTSLPAALQTTYQALLPASGAVGLNITGASPGAGGPAPLTPSEQTNLQFICNSVRAVLPLLQQPPSHAPSVAAASSSSSSPPPTPWSSAAPTVTQTLVIYNAFVISNTNGLNASSLGGSRRMVLQQSYGQLVQTVVQGLLLNQSSSTINNQTTSNNQTTMSNNQTTTTNNQTTTTNNQTTTTNNQTVTPRRMRVRRWTASIDDHRRLSVTGVMPGSPFVYHIYDSNCTAAAVNGSTCQTVYSFFSLNLTGSDNNYTSLNDTYTMATQNAIEAGLLEAILNASNPTVGIVVDGAISPTVLQLNASATVPASSPSSSSSTPSWLTVPIAIVIAAAAAAIISLCGIGLYATCSLCCRRRVEPNVSTDDEREALGGVPDSKATKKKDLSSKASRSKKIEPDEDNVFDVSDDVKGRTGFFLEDEDPDEPDIEVGDDELEKDIDPLQPESEEVDRNSFNVAPKDGKKGTSVRPRRSRFVNSQPEKPAPAQQERQQQMNIAELNVEAGGEEAEKNKAGGAANVSNALLDDGTKGKDVTRNRMSRLFTRRSTVTPRQQQVTREETQKSDDEVSESQKVSEADTKVAEPPALEAVTTPAVAAVAAMLNDEPETIRIEPPLDAPKNKKETETGDVSDGNKIEEFSDKPEDEGEVESDGDEEEEGESDEEEEESDDDDEEEEESDDDDEESDDDDDEEEESDEEEEESDDDEEEEESDEEADDSEDDDDGDIHAKILTLARQIIPEEEIPTMLQQFEGNEETLLNALQNMTGGGEAESDEEEEEDGTDDDDDDTEDEEEEEEEDEDDDDDEDDENSSDRSNREGGSDESDGSGEDGAEADSDNENAFSNEEDSEDEVSEEVGSAYEVEEDENEGEEVEDEEDAEDDSEENSEHDDEAEGSSEEGEAPGEESVGDQDEVSHSEGEEEKMSDTKDGSLLAEEFPGNDGKEAFDTDNEEQDAGEESKAKSDKHAVPNIVNDKGESLQHEAAEDGLKTDQVIHAVAENNEAAAVASAVQSIPNNAASSVPGDESREASAEAIASGETESRSTAKSDLEDKTNDVPTSNDEVLGVVQEAVVPRKPGTDGTVDGKHLAQNVAREKLQEMPAPETFADVKAGDEKKTLNNEENGLPLANAGSDGGIADLTTVERAPNEAG